MLVEEPDVRKALVRFCEGRGGNLRGAPRLLDLRLVLAAACCRAAEIAKLQPLPCSKYVAVITDTRSKLFSTLGLPPSGKW